MYNCSDCGQEREYLHSHHIIARVQGGSDDLSNIAKICANCHEDRHGGSCGGALSGTNSNTPEAKAKKSATMKAKLQQPEYKEKWRLAGIKAWEKRQAKLLDTDANNMLV